MKIIYLPFAIEKIVRVLSYFAVLFLDIVHFLLAPFTFMQFKAHVFMFSAAGLGYAYLRFFTHTDNALLLSIGGLVAIILAVFIIKCLRKALYRLRQSLIRIVYAPVGVSFVFAQPIFFKKTNNNFKKLVECVTFD